MKTVPVWGPAIALILLLLWLPGCGTNPVTGKHELQFISTTQEIRIGETAYFPTRQIQGGDYVVHPSVTAYVRGVNRRLEQVSDRDLPFEIVVLNSSVPNAWAMPGGKMAINRGLLLQLDSEAELAAVLGHEIVHSAARHGARAQERSLLLQGGLLATQIAAAGSEYSNLIAGGAVFGAQLVSTRYGRSAELEADLYGMEYMYRAGYNPAAAIDLQETFVRLSEGRQTSWLEGLFASHPPSQERVAHNIETAARLGGQDLEYGRQRYRAAMAPLVKDAAAYQAHDEAFKAAREKDYDKANELVDKAIRLQPKEAKFHGLKGDLALVQKQYKSATTYYNRAIQRYPEYFAFHLQKGLARHKLGDNSGAVSALNRSNELLATPVAHKVLGDIELAAGNEAAALEHYQIAASSNSESGQQARAAAARLEIEQQPDKYLKTRLGLDQQGNIIVAVQNQSPVAVKNVEVSLAYFDEMGRQVAAPRRVRLRGILEGGEQAQANTGLKEGRGLRSVVSKAALAE